MDVKVHFKAGGSFVDLPPQFSFNAENVYIAWKNKILGYNSKTGALFAEFKGIKDRIVGFGVHYYDSYECITACSASGELITWKVVTFFKLLNKKLDYSNIKTFHILPSENVVEALISHKQKNIISFSLYNITDGTTKDYGFKTNANLHHVSVCSNKFFVVTQRSSLNVILFKDLLKTYTYCIDKPREFTCVACHPEDEIVLTGDNTGRVVVWQKLFTAKPTKAVFHWHTLPVKCLGFSVTGSYFYSGGFESVLVRWQLNNHFERKFLPRLPSTISQITVSPSNTYIAVSTDDNAVRILDPRFSTVSLIQNLVIGNNFDSGIVVDPRTKCLIMNGSVGQIQFYSLHDNSLLYTVDVVGQNKVSNERSCKIENTQVSKIAISKNGLWLASVESRKDLEYSSELRLKFWQFDLKSQNFKLNTSIEDPHEDQIHSIAFQPSSNPNVLKCATVGGDKKFKIWLLSEFETIEKKSEIWKCLCVGFYHNLPCKDLSFSADGSLVAVSFYNIVTTWIPETCQLKCSLSHPLCKNEIIQVEFGTSNQSHLIVAASSDTLCVWNLLTLTMIWTVPVNISVLIANTVTTHMAVITTDNMVFVFSPVSPEPVFASDKVLRKHNGICAAAFVPNKYSNDVRLQWHQRAPIYFIDSKKELFCLGSEEENQDALSETHEFDKSLFSMTIPEEQINKSKSLDAVKHLYQKDLSQKSIKKYLEAPIQTMIPIRIMCGSLLKSMVLQKS